MLTETECLSKAADFNQLAALSLTEEMNGIYTEMATAWKRAAAMAAWHDRFTKLRR